MAERKTGVLGATSLVGDFLLNRWPAARGDLVAFSRRPVQEGPGPDRRISWVRLAQKTLPQLPQIEKWICLAPIWVLPDCFPLLEQAGTRRIVALSSTSLFTKTDSSDPAEREIATRLAAGEKQLVDWARQHGISWIILRPTLIYGLGRDKNISSIARFIRRFGFFPLLGPAKGLRQPIHATDVAAACVQALHQQQVADRAYNIGGGETLAYDEMVGRVFAALGRRPRYLVVPGPVFRMVIGVARLLPRFRHISVGMAERMNRDMVFDYSEAARDLTFSPGPFHLGEQDLPS
ncbi:NAD-dependent epimerase/dehydratase family protein [Desulfolithobacter sp.]